MTKEFVPYELAVKLKELGFDEYCMGACYYQFKNGGRTYILLHTPDDYDSHEGVKAPIYQQAFRWFREKYEIYYTIEGSKKFGFQHFIYDEKGSYEIKSEEIFKNYEEAELACLTKLIEIVEQAKN